MPQIIPIDDFEKTSELSQLCKSVSEPIFVTQNGYGDMVILSMETYSRIMEKNHLYTKLAEGENSISQGNVIDGFKSLADIRGKYNV